MATDLCGEDVVVRLSSSPQIISTETIVPASVGCDAAAAGRGAAPCGGVELGRRLLLAARAGDTGAVLELMAKGAPFSTDWLGTSPLHLAAANDHVETCAVLLRAGVSRDSRTKVERTPLHLAACAGHAAVVTLLLEHGAAADCRDMLLMTPLHWAAARGQLAAARALLRGGADPRLRCKFRKTPRCLALRANRPDLVALLEGAEEAAVSKRMIDEPLKEFKNVQRVEIKPQTKMKMQAEKKIIIESKTQPIPPSANVGRGAAAGGTVPGAAGPAAGGAVPGAAGPAVGGAAPGAAALLRAHGITLLPADRGSTVLTALRSGRTVVLSDAGKLMLKESISEPPAAPPHAAAGETAHSAGGAGGPDGVGGREVRARPAKCGKGVKLLTLNKNQPLKRVIHPNDLQQVKLVRMPAARPVAGGPAADKAAARLRPALKIVLDKAHLSRLLATTRAPQTSTTSYALSEAPPAQPPALDERSLRAQLAEARATVAELGAELRSCRARLAHYEGAQLQ